MSREFKNSLESSSNSPSPSSSSIMENKKKCNDRRGLVIEGYRIEGLSIGGQEICAIFPSLKLAFDIGRCPQRAIAQDFLFISHGHMDHIGGLPMYVATRGLFSMKPPTIFVPTAIKEHVQKLFAVHRAMDQSELKHNLVALDMGEEFYIRKDLKVKAFKTYHVVPSQGYIIYSIKQKLKQEYIGHPGNEIKDLKLSGLESTFLDNTVAVEHAREYGRTHLAEIVQHAEMFQNKALLLIHFSVRYTVEEIEAAVSRLPSTFAGRVFALTEGI